MKTVIIFGLASICLITAQDYCCPWKTVGDTTYYFIRKDPIAVDNFNCKSECIYKKYYTQTVTQPYQPADNTEYCFKMGILPSKCIFIEDYIADPGFTVKNDGTVGLIITAHYVTLDDVDCETPANDTNVILQPGEEFTFPFSFENANDEICGANQLTGVLLAGGTGSCEHDVVYGNDPPTYYTAVNVAGTPPCEITPGTSSDTVADPPFIMTNHLPQNIKWSAEYDATSAGSPSCPPYSGVNLVGSSGIGDYPMGSECFIEKVTAVWLNTEAGTSCTAAHNVGLTRTCDVTTPDGTSCIVTC